jgi:hypothetical protein
MHGFGMAAADLPAENPLAGAIADIGVEQDRGDAARMDDFDDPGQRRHHRFERGELAVTEAARLLRGPARGVDGAVNKK